MKYSYSFILLLFALSLQSLQAATFVQTPTTTTPTIEDRLLNSMDTNIFGSSQIIGVGQIAKVARQQAPIQTLAKLTQTEGLGGRNDIRMGQRLFTFMDTAIQSQVTSLINVDPTLAVSTDIIDGDTNVDSVSVESGRMYPPRLCVDFQKFPIPTYANMTDEVQQKRMDKLNNQLQKQFGKTVKVDYLENVHYLRGTVVSERQKEILEIFIKMEPGIQEVRSEIVVRE